MSDDETNIATGIEWGSPPRRARNSSPWEELLAPFRDRPGEWGKLPGTYRQSMSQAIRDGRVSAAQPAGSFEATERTAGDGPIHIWVRYVGATP